MGSARKLPPTFNWSLQGAFSGIPRCPRTCSFSLILLLFVGLIWVPVLRAGGRWRGSIVGALSFRAHHLCGGGRGPLQRGI